MTQAIYYPPADRTTQWFGPANAIVAPNKVLWHTTETSGGWPGYGVGGGSCPNLTYEPWKHQWRQHLPLNGTARALANATGYQTNRQGTVQVELSCTNGWQASAVAAGKAVWMFDDQAIKDLADFSRFMHDEWGVPLTTSVAWPAYPTAPARLSPAGFTAYRGHCGHMHAPYQDHGDPGGLAVPRFLAIAQGSTPPPTEDDMPYTQQQIIDMNKSALRGYFAPGQDEGYNRIVAACNESIKQSSYLIADSVAAKFPSLPKDSVKAAVKEAFTESFTVQGTVSIANVVAAAMAGSPEADAPAEENVEAQCPPSS